MEKNVEIVNYNDFIQGYYNITKKMNELNRESKQDKIDELEENILILEEENENDINDEEIEILKAEVEELKVYEEEVKKNKQEYKSLEKYKKNVRRNARNHKNLKLESAENEKNELLKSEDEKISALILARDEETEEWKKELEEISELEDDFEGNKKEEYINTIKEKIDKINNETDEKIKAIEENKQKIIDDFSKKQEELKNEYREFLKKCIRVDRGEEISFEESKEQDKKEEKQEEKEEKDNKEEQETQVEQEESEKQEEQKEQDKKEENKGKIVTKQPKEVKPKEPKVVTPVTPKQAEVKNAEVKKPKQAEIKNVKPKEVEPKSATIKPQEQESKEKEKNKNHTIEIYYNSKNDGYIIKNMDEKTKSAISRSELEKLPLNKYVKDPEILKIANDNKEILDMNIVKLLASYDLKYKMNKLEKYFEVLQKNSLALEINKALENNKLKVNYDLRNIYSKENGLSNEDRNRIFMLANNQKVQGTADVEKGFLVYVREKFENIISSFTKKSLALPAVTSRKENNKNTKSEEEIRQEETRRLKEEKDFEEALMIAEEAERRKAEAKKNELKEYEESKKAIDEAKNDPKFKEEMEKSMPSTDKETREIIALCLTGHAAKNTAHKRFTDSLKVDVNSTKTSNEKDNITEEQVIEGLKKLGFKKFYRIDKTQKQNNSKDER